MDSNLSVFESKNQSYFEYLDSKQIWIKREKLQSRQN